MAFEHFIVTVVLCLEDIENKDRTSDKDGLKISLREIISRAQYLAFEYFYLGRVIFFFSTASRSFTEVQSHLFFFWELVIGFWGIISYYALRKISYIIFVFFFFLSCSLFERHKK